MNVSFVEKLRRKCSVQYVHYPRVRAGLVLMLMYWFSPVLLPIPLIYFRIVLFALLWKAAKIGQDLKDLNQIMTLNTIVCLLFMEVSNYVMFIYNLVDV